MNARDLDITDSGPASHHDSVGHPKTAGMDTTAIGLELVSGWEVTGKGLFPYYIIIFWGVFPPLVVK